MVAIAPQRRGLYLPDQMPLPQRCPKCGGWVMSAGYRQLDADGYTKLHSTGAELRVDEDQACCCGGCMPRLRLTFEDVLMCAMCHSQTQVASFLPTSISINGQYEVDLSSTAVAGQCIYDVFNTFPVAVEGESHFGAGCQAFIENRSSSLGRLQLVYSIALAQFIEINLYVFFTNMSPQNYSLFDAFSVSGLGGLGVPIANENVCGTLSNRNGHRVVGYQGTLTIEAV